MIIERFGGNVRQRSAIYANPVFRHRMWAYKNVGEITTEMLRNLWCSLFQQPNVGGGDVYIRFMRINSPMIHLGFLKIYTLI